jgi:hypothetical protein
VTENERFKSPSVFAVFINMSLFDDLTYASTPEKTKSATDKPNVLGDVEMQIPCPWPCSRLALLLD